MINISYKIPTIGIYKITSPSGKVYIGQSTHIYKRWAIYKALNRKAMGPKLFNSLTKYGVENHKFEVIEECNKEELDILERKWKTIILKETNNDWNKVLFCELFDNSSGPKSEETKQKISNSIKRKNIKFSEEKRKILSEKRKQYWINKKNSLIKQH